jgi:F-type H+-transporting ATPase subunit b
MESETAHHVAANLPPMENPTVWAAIAIALFIVLMWKAAKRALVAMTDKHAAEVMRQLDEARSLRLEAEQLIVQYRHKREEAQMEAVRIVDHAKAEAKRLLDDAQIQLKDTMARREQQTLDKIARLEGDAVKELRGQAVDMALATTQKMLKDALDAQRQAFLIDQAIKEMPKTVH